MDYDDSLIFHTVVTDRTKRGTRAYDGLTAKEICERTGLDDQTVSKKVTRSGRLNPELRQADPYPYLDKEGNRYRLNKRTQEHLIQDPRHCKIFLLAVALSREAHQAVGHDMLVTTCAQRFNMNPPYVEQTIGDLLKRGYLVEDTSLSGGRWHVPSETDYEQERIYYAFLLHVLEPRALGLKRKDEILAKTLAGLDQQLLRIGEHK